MNPRLAELIAETLDIPVAKVTPELTRDEHPAWDSLNHLRLVTALEEEFGVQLSMDEIESTTTAAQLDALVAAQASG
ncbi:MAG: acyl carrier protein [Geminicoccaceae bacterium]